VSPLNSAKESTARPQAEHSRIGLWSTLFIAGLFSAVSVLSSAVPGVNEPHYLAKARAFVDPAWCSRDFFLTSANAHYCFFWLVGQMTEWLSFDQIAVVGRIFSATLLAIGWTLLARAVHLRAIFSIPSAAMFASLSLLGSFSGEWLLGGFESKVPAWGLCLIAVSLWISGRGSVRSMLLAGIICGLGCSLHPVVGGWVAACLCMASAFVLVSDWRSKRSQGSDKNQRSVLAGLIAFSTQTILFALPGLIPALTLVLDKSLPQKDRELASFYQVFWRLKHHLDPTEIPGSQWLYLLLVGSGLLAGVAGLKRCCREKSRPDGLRWMLVFFGMSALIALAGVMIGWHTVRAQELDGWEWRASLLKFYPFRCFDALLPITTALVFGRLVQACSQPSEVQSAFNSGTFAGRLLSNPVLRKIAFGIILLLPLWQSWHSREAAPAGYTVDQFTDWREACDWLREKTPKDALILTPRESSAFKWLAERAEYVCYKDCPQDAAGILTWNRRLWLLHDWTLQSSTDALYDNRDLRILRAKTDCDFIVTRILGPFETEPLWEGQHWKIYAVPPRE
jgi:hypothetical protein